MGNVWLGVLLGFGVFIVLVVSVFCLDKIERRGRAKTRRVMEVERRRQRDAIARVRRDGAPLPSTASRVPALPPRRVTSPRQRKPANPNLPRVQCDVCLHMITLTKAGCLRVHGTGDYYHNCSGSGKRYVEYIIQEEPV